MVDGPWLMALRSPLARSFVRSSARRFALALPVFAMDILFLLLASAGWLIQPTNTRSSFRGLSVVDAKTAWASGSRGKFLRTTDGATWALDSIAGADSLDLRDIQAFDAMTAVAISAGPAEKGQAKIFRTADGG